MRKIDQLAEIRDGYHKFFQVQPEAGDLFMAHFETAYQSSVLEAKTKHLVALCGGIIAGCKGCILGQTDLALEQGATAEEVLEVCTVAMSLGGTLAGSQVSLVVQFLEERGMLPRASKPGEA
ncbi:MAG: carboxymuconolactone decarboxylase family protein [Desulfarculaceae bacterium]|nr:carboxymuconolactone decarboxylase family protein [Desulfarculaceae bacterium]MCF8073122.1 carboxymuconolactone decarboxylase family protein [Desulfarculaceae bacterium]MCF8101793.1 carboxymuconolactone decarboxylase family protein [Desulfarculaceae bacterium]MCF8117357.1 carboxymuconolactone decarboxylase family protein [Desulfarculaceae bacterium]